MFRILSLIVCLLSFKVYANENPPIVQLNGVIICDEADHVIEILETYQSDGFKYAHKIFQRLNQEKNENGDSKCIIGKGTYVVIKELGRILLEEKNMLTGIIYMLYDVRMKIPQYTLIFMSQQTGS